jgi:hypothetical protein
VVVDEARRTEVNDLYLTAGVRLDQNVLWFQITVDQLQSVNMVQCVKNLFSDSLESWHIEVKFLFHFSIVLGVLIEVISE